MSRRDDVEKELRRLRWQLLSGACLALLGIGFLIRLQDEDPVAAKLLGTMNLTLGMLLLAPTVWERRRLRRELDEL